MLVIEEIFWGFSVLSIIFYYLFRSLIMTLQLPSSCQWIPNVMVHQLGCLHYFNSHSKGILVHDGVPSARRGSGEESRHKGVTGASLPSPLCQEAAPKIHYNSHEHHITSNVILHENVSLDRKNVHVEPIKLRKRPSKLLVPEFSSDHKELFSVEKRRVENVEFKAQEIGYSVLSKKGKREHIEDRFKVISDIFGDPNQAFFAVIDGHGGQDAANYVADNLGKNIVKQLEIIVKEADQQVVEHAISEGYFQTDKDFLKQGLGSGACTASVLLRNGELYAANVGDCRVVLSRAGLATRLTNDHCLSREDERLRIENSGGFVHDNNNGIWRVQGTLAVSRAFGDQHLKDWIICEPEIKHVPLTSDCEFLIVASDGLWDKVSEQEAVANVSREENAMESCKKLVDMSCNRGNRDDITVMVINLQKFVTAF